MEKIEVVLGDITKEDVDAIANAANENLLGGGGVDGAIHRACGKELKEECEKLGGCPTGQAKITKAYNLNNQGIGWIIHAVGPKWMGGFSGEENMLRSAYQSILNIAVNYKNIYMDQCLRVLENHIGEDMENEKERLEREIKEEVKNYIDTYPIKSIALPSISTGVYGYPLEKAVPIALDEILEFSKKESNIEKLRIICFDEVTYRYYNDELLRKSISQ